MKKQKLVTKESIRSLIYNPKKQNKAIGRALIALFNNQTAYEKTFNTVETRNKRGFSASDANRGTKDAKFYLENGFLDSSSISYWMTADITKTERIAKYHRQLNDAAIKKSPLIQYMQDNKCNAGSVEFSNFNEFRNFIQRNRTWVKRLL
jgi:hypothetical protein